MEVSHSPPNVESFTPFSVHQSQTPESFYSGPPILYHHSPSTTLLIHSHDLEAAPALAELVPSTHRGTNGTAGHVNGDGNGEEDTGQELSISNIGVWVTSESVKHASPSYFPLLKLDRRLFLYSPSQNARVSISYPSISLHATQIPTASRPASLFLQLLTQEQAFDDHDPESTVSLTVIPTPTAPTTATTEGGDDNDAESQPQDDVPLLFAALSACANLHPDPASDSEGEDGGGRNPTIMFEGDADVSGIYPLGNGGGGLPPPMPGSGGWITAENVGEFFDEEGNFRGGGGLGEGAGSVRTREEDGDDEENGDGVEDETKWRRTE